MNEGTEARNPAISKVMPAEVEEAARTADQIAKFSDRMRHKMNDHQGSFEPWDKKHWKRDEIDLEIQKALLERDYITVANFAMFANALQDATGEARGTVNGAEVVGGSPGKG